MVHLNWSGLLLAQSNSLPKLPIKSFEFDKYLTLTYDDSSSNKTNDSNTHFAIIYNKNW